MAVSNKADEANDVSEVHPGRRRLFQRAQAEHPLTPLKLRLLLFVAECSVLTVPQLAQLAGLTEKSARGHMRDLFDLGLVERCGVPRAALAGLDTPNTPELLWGRAPTIYSLSRAGARVLVEAGLKQKHEVADLPEYGPTNALFLAHEVQVRDVRVWLAQVERVYPAHGGVLTWRDGARATIELGRAEYPRQARPDAWFVYRLQEATLVGLVEVDRGTERSPARWQEKVGVYAVLLSGSTIQELTTHKQARVLVITPDVRRREAIAGVIEEVLPDVSLPPDRFWIAEKAALRRADLSEPVWRVPGRAELMPLVPARLLA